MDRNELAILVNKLGGYDETEREIGVDAELIERAVIGEGLTRLEQGEVETGINEYIMFSNKVDVNDVEKLAQDLSNTTGFFYDVDFSNDFRRAVAEGDIDAEILETGGTMFANFTPKMMDDVRNLITSGEGNVKDDLNRMFEGYINDYNNGIPFWRSDQLAHDSEFWEWFRETFYAETE